MPLTPFQAELGRLLAQNRSEDSYLAGAAGILVRPNTQRYSHDLDYFHDTAERVAAAYTSDRTLLLAEGYEVEPELTQPGYIQAVVRRGGAATKVEWAYDWTASSTRVLPAAVASFLISADLAGCSRGLSKRPIREPRWDSRGAIGPATPTRCVHSEELLR